jgi:tetracycline 7-halogenase / FADH2 O2-dependent halogenase
MIASDHVAADVAVVGSGFAGSLIALALKRRERRVVLIERGRHPRFAIGESSTPLANLLLEELADRYDLPRLRSFSKWGTWQRAHPEVACGLKRGFTFFFHQPGQAFTDDEMHDRQLMVAASPFDEVSDTHWYRPDFDHALVRDAQAAGINYLDDTALDTYDESGPRAVLAGARGGQPIRITAEFVVDASGPRGFMHRVLRLTPAPLRWLPHTHGLYSHFENVDRWDRLTPSEGTPYQPDDAALHHVFPGGWIWVLRFNNGITSAGAALTDAFASTLDLARPETAWNELLAQLPSVGHQFQSARAILPFVHVPRLAFRAQRIRGQRWAMLPSAAGVIDPLLSTGFPLTLLGITRLLEVLETTSAGAQRDAALGEYARITEAELDVTEQLVAALYATMGDAALFKRLSLMYFAAASYSEAVRRLGRPRLAPGFLLHGHPQFGPEVLACATLASSPLTGEKRSSLLGRIDRAIQPFDTAGLLDDSRKSWYPVLSDDLMAGATKLGATAEEIHRMLEQCGFQLHDVQHSRSAFTGPLNIVPIADSD